MSDVTINISGLEGLIEEIVQYKLEARKTQAEKDIAEIQQIFKNIGIELSPKSYRDDPQILIDIGERLYKLLPGTQINYWNTPVNQNPKYKGDRNEY